MDLTVFKDKYSLNQPAPPNEPYSLQLYFGLQRLTLPPLTSLAMNENIANLLICERFQGLSSPRVFCPPPSLVLGMKDESIFWVMHWKSLAKGKALAKVIVMEVGLGFAVPMWRC